MYVVSSPGIVHSSLHACVYLRVYVCVVAWFARAAEVTFARKYVCTNIVMYVLLYAYIIMLMHVHTHILANTYTTGIGPENSEGMP
jgi:hypothetical protein